MVDRRNFLGLVGAAGVGSLLLPDDSLAALAGGKLASATPTPTAPVGAPSYSQVKIVTDLGIGRHNIALVRQAILDTIPADELQKMADYLVAARTSYASGYVGTPAEALSLEERFLFYAEALAAKVELKAGLAAMSDPDEDPIDAWTLVHFLSGAALGAICLDFKKTLILLILWEIIEPFIWEGWHESPINQIVDVIAGMLGWYLAKRAKERILEFLGLDGDKALAAAAGSAG